MNLERVKETIINMGETLAPEEDWMPMLIFEKNQELMICGLAGDSMKDKTSKDITAKLMTFLIRDIQPDSATFICTAWSVECNKTESGLGAFTPSTHPNRIEIVICLSVSPESEQFMIGKILRDPNKPPKIIEWVVADKETQSDGRFTEAMKEGFKKRKGKNGKTTT